MKGFKRLFSILLVCFLVFYFVPLIIEGLKPETETIRARITGIRTAHVMGRTMAYEMKGSGYPVVLIHGFSHSALCWEKTIGALAGAGYKVYAIDLFGHGMSDKPYGIKYTLDLYARQVHDFMKETGIPRAHIVGHSMGGAVAIKFADLYPGMANRLVLIGSAGIRHGGRHNTLFSLLRYPLIGEFLINLDFKPVMRRALSEITLNNRMDITDEYLARYVLPTGTRGFNYTFLRILRNFDTPEWDASSSVARINNPSLIIHGIDDKLVDVSSAKMMHHVFKNSTLLLIRKGPHSVMETDPVPVNNAILQFLKKGGEAR